MENISAVKALAALAQSKRLAVFRLLVEAGPTGSTAGEIATAVDVPPSSLNFHLKELAHAALIESRQDGRFVFYSANYETMNELMRYLTENCCARDGVTCAVTSCSLASTKRRKSKSKSKSKA